MSQHCPKCQTEQAEDSRRCVRCGVPLTVPEERGKEADTEAPAMPLFTFAQLGSNPSLAAINQAEEHELLEEPLLVSEPELIGTHSGVAGHRGTRSLPWIVLIVVIIVGVAGLHREKHAPPPTTKSAAVSVPPAISSPPASLSPLAPSASPNVAASGALSLPIASPSLPSPRHRLPLAVTLRSSTGKSIAVGNAVTLSASTTLPLGRGPVLTILYRHGHDPARLLAQAQGILCRALWTPAKPGNYIFTAKVLDNQRRRAEVGPLTFRVAATPRLTPKLLPKRVQENRLALSHTGLKRIAFRHIALGRTTGRHTAARLPASLFSLHDTFPQTIRPLHSPTRFHVAAAAFLYKRSATVLATALHQQGLPAVVRQQKSRRGKLTYVVQTGVFSVAPAAQQQSQKLQHDGYPAYTYLAP